MSRPVGPGSSCAIDTWPIVLGSFMLCPPSGDGRVFKPCHQPGGAEFVQLRVKIFVTLISVNPVVLSGGSIP